MNHRLAEVDKRRSEFLTSVSHDLRTPLNSVLGFVRLLLDGMYESDEEAREFLENTRVSASHMLNLVTDVLSATQIETGQLRMNLEAVHAGDVVHDVLRVMEAQARENEVRLLMEVEGSAMVLADVPKARQVLVNLVGNAVNYTRAGTVVVRTSDDGDMVRFVVSDTGEGIPQSELERVFEKFHRVPSPTTRTTGGTGLGLTISRELVQRMGGTIRAYSEGLGKGARFEFTLPVATREHASSTAVS